MELDTVLSFQLAAEGQAMICSTANRALLAYEIAVPHVFGPKKKANKVGNRDGVGESGGDVCVVAPILCVLLAGRHDRS